MCVTNTTQRRPVKLSGAQLQAKPSEQAQRICSSLFLPPPIPESFVLNKTKANNRKRKPQKPGKTAKNHDRHFVIHSYHDHSLDRDEEEPAQPQKRRRGGVSVAFPMKLHAMLDQIEKDGLGHIISWQPHGRCFVVHKPKQFVEDVLQQYFKQSKMTSFQRQLNLYGFQRLTRGNDAGGYYHELFLRGKTFLCKQMSRTKVKGTGFKAASSPDDEPDFWKMAPVNPITPPHSEDDSSMDSEEESSEPPRATNFAVPTFSPVKAVPAIPTSFAFEPPKPDIQSSSSPQQEREEEMAIEPIPLNESESTSSTSESEVLDEVVDELFLHETAAEEQNTILDFVNTWNPDSSKLDDEEIVDDFQLGLLLERILES